MTAPRDPFFPAERSIRASDKPLEVRFLGRMDYQEAWDYQAEVAAARAKGEQDDVVLVVCLLYTSPSPRDKRQSRMPSSA